MRKELRTFIGGLVIGAIIGAGVGGVAVAMVGATAFIDYSISHPCPTIQSSQLYQF